MCFKNPQRVLVSFFVKDQGYRVRIADIEHFLSVYVQYQKHLKLNEIPEKSYVSGIFNEDYSVFKNVFH